MRVLLNIIVVASLLGTSWCGLILHNIRDGLHSKLYGHGLNGQSNPNSPIININNQQQVVQQPSAVMPASYHTPSGPRGDYGSLPLDHNAYGSSMDSNFKAAGSKYGLTPYGQHGDSSYYGSHHHMGGGFRGETASGISSHQMMKQESYKRPQGPKFGYHHDNNMFGNAQGLSASNNDVPLYASTSSSSSSSASSSSASSALGTASSSSAVSSSSSASSSSSGAIGGGFRPRSRRY